MDRAEERAGPQDVGDQTLIRGLDTASLKNPRTYDATAVCSSGAVPVWHRASIM